MSIIKINKDQAEPRISQGSSEAGYAFIKCRWNLERHALRREGGAPVHSIHQPEC